MEDELRINLVVSMGILSSFVLLFAYLYNFFIHPQIVKSQVSIFQVLGSFLTFLFSPVVVAPILIAGTLWTTSSDPFNPSISNLSMEQKGWLNFTIIICTALLLSSYVWFNRDVALTFFDPDKKGPGLDGEAIWDGNGRLPNSNAACFYSQSNAGPDS